MAQTGLSTIDDLLALQDRTVVDIGEDTIAEVLANDLENFNEQVMGMMSDLAETTTDVKRRYGTNDDGSMTKVDEFGAPTTQKTQVGDTVEFPLHKFVRNIGWTRDFMARSSPADLAKKQIATQKGYLAAHRAEIRKAIFFSSNETVFDEFNENVDLSVKRLVNADGAKIPFNQHNESFDGSTHTHYNANDWSGATDEEKNTDVRDLIDDVVEHDHGEMVRLYINRSQESTVKGLADFTKYEDPRIILRNTDAPNERLDITRVNNRAIGILDAAEVWVKPWIPQNYMFCFSAGDSGKPLVRRSDPVFGVQLRLANELESYPLRAEVYDAYFGFGVWTRTNGAVLYVGGNSYTDPSL